MQELVANLTQGIPKCDRQLNDEGFNPVAAVSSDCHVNFSIPTNYAHSQVASLMRATPQKVEDVLASIRSNLLRIIQNWERSEQGEGGRHAVGGEDDEDGKCDDPEDLIIFNTTSVRFGSLSTSRSECALQNRAAFLCGKRSHLLYFWGIADRHQLLQSALQRLLMTLPHLMHHRLLVLQAVKLLVLTTDDDSDSIMNKRLHFETYWLSLSPFDSSPKQKMTVKSVVELLTFKTSQARKFRRLHA
jgi:hypothetical protein